jgi:hypothetical protein
MLEDLWTPLGSELESDVSELELDVSITVSQEEISDMSPKSKALVRLYVSIAILAIPGLASVLTQGGLQKAAAVLTLVGSAIATVYHAYQTAISSLPDADGNTGAGATKLGGSYHPPPLPPTNPYRMPQTEDARSTFSMAGFLLAVAVTVSGCAWFKSNGPTVVSDLGGITSCVLAAADSTPPPTLAAIASDCGGIAIQDVMTILDQLLSDEEGSATPNTIREAHLTALGADGTRAKHKVSR